MAQTSTVKLFRSQGAPWGFRLQGGKDFGTPLTVAKVAPGSLAYEAGLRYGDAIVKVNDSHVDDLRHKDAQDVIIKAGNSFELTVRRGASSSIWKQPPPTNAAPVIAPPASNGVNDGFGRTPLAPTQQWNQSNSVTALVHQQYNSPVALYSMDNIADALSKHTEILSTGAVGVNFKKYDPSVPHNSEVLRLLQGGGDEAPRLPPNVRQFDGPPPSFVPRPQSGGGSVGHQCAQKPGDNACYECGRQIVGQLSTGAPTYTQLGSTAAADIKRAASPFGASGSIYRQAAAIPSGASAHFTWPPRGDEAARVNRDLGFSTSPVPTYRPPPGTQHIQPQPTFGRPGPRPSSPIPPVKSYSPTPPQRAPYSPQMSPAMVARPQASPPVLPPILPPAPAPVIPFQASQRSPITKPQTSPGSVPWATQASQPTPAPWTTPASQPSPAPWTAAPAPAPAPVLAPAQAPAPAAVPQRPAPPGATLPGARAAPKRGRGTMNPAVQGQARIPMCAICGSPIRGPFVTAMGKTWCPDHFHCATPQCRRSLQDVGFVEEQGALYCENCYEQFLAPVCCKCNTRIKGDCLNAIQKQYHPECFCCAFCNKPFGNAHFYLEDGLPYCEKDWNEQFTTKCVGCGFPIEAGDRWVEALNNNYHSQCFKCSICHKNLEGQSFFAKGGRPFCKSHAR